MKESLLWVSVIGNAQMAAGCARYVAERESCVCMWRCNAMQQKTEMIMMMMMRVRALMRERLCVSG